MLAIHYTVLPHGQKWKLSDGELQLGIYDTQDAAIQAGKKAVDQAKASGVDAELQVLGPYGELSQVDLGRPDWRPDPMPLGLAPTDRVKAVIAPPPSPDPRAKDV